MRYLYLIAFISLLSTGCNCNESSDKGAEATKVEKKKAVKDTVPRVTGIGGVFFGTPNPAEAREWYGKNLGLAIDEYGSPFEFRNANDPDEINYLRWAPAKSGSDYFKPSENEFMINYRVQNIDGLLRKLQANNVTILDSIAVYDYGKFLHIMDHAGNKIELWEPVDSVLTKMGAKTTR